LLGLFKKKLTHAEHIARARAKLGGHKTTEMGVEAPKFSGNSNPALGEMMYQH